MYFRKIHHVIAGFVCLICTLLGIWGYMRPPAKDAPPKIWFEAEAGDVVFNHTYHVSLAACDACHHEEVDESARHTKCRDCHYYGEARLETGPDETHPRMIGGQCVSCHTSMEVSTQCESCHTSRRMVPTVVGSKLPRLPASVTFDTEAGRVVFDHALHVGLGEDAPCKGCHHEASWPPEQPEKAKNCRACHYDQAARIGPSDDENHKRYIGLQCANCHDPEDCSTCHEF